MKKILLVSVAYICMLSSIAQISNNSFEQWYSGTGTFEFAPFIALDTFDYTSPVDWTCSNSITMSGGLHHSQFADSSTLAFAGNKGLYLRTDTIYIDAASLYLVIPGFVINGNFNLKLTDVLNGSGGLNPASISGAGDTISAKKKSIGFHLKYSPVPNDSCLVWAILKKGNQKIAEAKFNTTQTLSNYTYFEKDFTYYSCETPDTVVILVSSSNPNFTTLGSGSTGLNRGSELFFDSIQLFDFPNGNNFAPIALRDAAFTLWNSSKTINVLANDIDCENDSLTVSIYTNPLHGTASLNTNQEIVYVSDINYSGKDSLRYSLSDGNSTSITTVEISIFSTSAVAELADKTFSVFPNPASSSITIQSTISQVFNTKMFDAEGRLVKELNAINGSRIMQINELNNGIYLLQYFVDGSREIHTKQLTVIH